MNENAGENQPDLLQDPIPGAPAAGAGPDLPPAPAAPGVNIPPSPIKRPRGRPRKIGLTLPPPGSAAGPAAAGAAGVADQSAANPLPALWTAESCRLVSQLPSYAAIAATGWKGWALDPKEAEMLAEPLAQTLNLLLPSGGKYAAVSALLATFSVIAGVKYTEYQKHLKNGALS